MINALYQVFCLCQDFRPKIAYTLLMWYIDIIKQVMQEQGLSQQAFADILGINQTTISHQLKQLKDQNIVSYKRDGKILVYYLLNENVNDMMMYAINAF